LSGGAEGRSPSVTGARGRMGWFFGILHVMVLLDQWTKRLVVDKIHLWERIPVIDGFFDLVHYRNTGVAFGLFRDGNQALVVPFFVLLAVGAVLFIGGYLWRAGQVKRTELIALSLIAAGAVGNGIDRAQYGSVVDFLLFYLGRYAWPAFNVADTGISIGGVLLAWDLFFGQQASSSGPTTETSETGES